MSWLCARALRSMVSIARAAAASSSLPERNMCAQPTTAFRGVRSSWERVARNWSLARLAASASCSSRSRSSWARRRSVMSTADPT